LEPLIPDSTSWFEKLDEFKSEPFPPQSRHQPKTPKRDVFD
jgi:hypothetical protein